MQQSEAPPPDNHHRYLVVRLLAARPHLEPASLVCVRGYPASCSRGWRTRTEVIGASSRRAGAGGVRAASCLVGPENDAASTVHSSSAQGGDEDGLDGVEPVLGLVEDDAGG
jgi:hypothetical protein